MELQPDSWLTETQSTLKGATTASMKRQYARVRRAKARENWYNSGISSDGQLVKQFKFVEQKELRGQNNSKLISSIRSHVKQNTYITRQATNAALQDKKKNSLHLHVLRKADPRFWCQEYEARPSTADQYGTNWNLRGDEEFTGHWLNDPFNTFGGYDPFNQPQALFLLNHYRYQAIKTLHPKAVEAVVEWTRSNIILLHATLYCAACHIEAITHSKDYSDIFYYRGEALKLVNQILDDPVARISNETIGGLCHLVMTEEIYGSRRAASFHRTGLAKLLQLRRTLSETSMNALVCHLLPLTNLRLPLKHFLPTRRSYILEEDDQGSLEQKDPVLEVFAWLKDTNLELPVNPPETECRSAVVQINLEYDLYLPKAHRKHRIYRRCWLLAAMIYLHTILAAPDGWHLLPVMELQLIEELRDLTEAIMGNPSQPHFETGLQLWILLFGGIHARDSNAVWFRGAIKTFCDAEYLLEWEDVKVSVKRLPSIHYDVEEILKGFHSLCMSKH